MELKAFATCEVLFKKKKKDVVVLSFIYLAQVEETGFTSKVLSPGRKTQPSLTHTIWLITCCYLLGGWPHLPDWIQGQAHEVTDASAKYWATF